MEILDSKERIGTIEDSQAPLFDTTHGYDGLELKKITGAGGKRNHIAPRRSFNDKLSVDSGSIENGNYDLDSKSYSSAAKESQ